MRRDHGQHPIRIGHYVGVGHPHKAEALGGKPGRALFVIVLLAGVGVSIDFDHQLRLGAEEIHNIWADPDLSAKLVTVELAGAEVLSKALLGGSGLLTRIAYAV